jgi:cytidylate kinase
LLGRTYAEITPERLADRDGITLEEAERQVQVRDRARAAPG